MTVSRVLIVGPSSLLAEGVATLFRREQGFEVTIVSPEEAVSDGGEEPGSHGKDLEARIAKLGPDILVLVDTPEGKRGSGLVTRLLEEAVVPIVLCVNPDESQVRIYSEREVPAQVPELLAAVRGLFPSEDRGSLPESSRKRAKKREKI
ncbi:MAG: hypothetical protein HYY65_12230 [Candidatus Tectomicrobia bacterium]|uniref:Uncharacterized protein n=1 Tax=Tectimicrobiota bacterium TaxID=2528274 RepID=A0A932GR16_UNCTE|nr:hypothetical protein [Candidatus Tectomicrobia bacterium]